MTGLKTTFNLLNNHNNFVNIIFGVCKKKVSFFKPEFVNLSFLIRQTSYEELFTGSFSVVLRKTLYCAKGTVSTFDFVIMTPMEFPKDKFSQQTAKNLISDIILVPKHKTGFLPCRYV